MKKLFYLTIAFALILAGCSPSGNTPELTGISLNKKSISIDVDETYQLRVRYEPEDAADAAPEVVWESSKTRIATVSDKGKVTGLKTGTAVITATCGKFTAECEVEVVKSGTNTDPDYTFTLSRSSINAPAAGGTYQIDITSNTEWSAEADADWVTVSPESGMMNGSVEVTVSASGTTAETTATLTFSYGKSGKKEVSITREGRDAVTVSVVTTVIPVTGGQCTFTVLNSDDWDVTCFAESDVTFKDKTSTSVTVVFPDMSSGNLRSKYLEWEHQLIFRGTGMYELWRTVKQECPYFYFTNWPDEVPAAGGDYTVNVKSNLSWSVYATGLIGNGYLYDETQDTHTSLLTGMKGDGSFRFHVNPNTSTTARQISITIRTGGHEPQYSFTQKGK